MGHVCPTHAPAPSLSHGHDESYGFTVLSHTDRARGGGHRSKVVFKNTCESLLFAKRVPSLPSRISLT